VKPLRGVLRHRQHANRPDARTLPKAAIPSRIRSTWNIQTHPFSATPFTTPPYNNSPPSPSQPHRHHDECFSFPPHISKHRTIARIAKENLNVPTIQNIKHIH
jgi:hypothetical protein